MQAINNKPQLIGTDANPGHELYRGTILSFDDPNLGKEIATDFYERTRFTSPLAFLFGDDSSSVIRVHKAKPGYSGVLQVFYHARSPSDEVLKGNTPIEGALLESSYNQMSVKTEKYRIGEKIPSEHEAVAIHPWGGAKEVRPLLQERYECYHQRLTLEMLTEYALKKGDFVPIRARSMCGANDARHIKADDEYKRVDDSTTTVFNEIKKGESKKISGKGVIYGPGAMSVHLIQKAVAAAREQLTLPGLKTGSGQAGLVLLVSSKVGCELMRDADWLAQSHRGLIEAKNQPSQLRNGEILGVIGGVKVVIIEGLDGYSPNPDVSLSLLLGASAGVEAWSLYPKFVVESTDYGRNWGYVLDEMVGYALYSSKFEFSDGREVEYPLGVYHLYTSRKDPQPA